MVDGRDFQLWGLVGRNIIKRTLMRTFIKNIQLQKKIYSDDNALFVNLEIRDSGHLKNFDFEESIYRIILFGKLGGCLLPSRQNFKKFTRKTSYLKNKTMYTFTKHWTKIKRCYDIFFRLNRISYLSMKNPGFWYNFCFGNVCKLKICDFLHIFLFFIANLIEMNT